MVFIHFMRWVIKPIKIKKDNETKRFNYYHQGCIETILAFQV